MVRAGCLVARAGAVTFGLLEDPLLRTVGVVRLDPPLLRTVGVVRLVPPLLRTVGVVRLDPPLLRTVGVVRLVPPLLRTVGVVRLVPPLLLTVAPPEPDVPPPLRGFTTREEGLVVPDDVPVDPVGRRWSVGR